ncbi:MAG: hypothetical protein PVJ52_02250 [Candidatus Woesebacteria bacterium]|jgi:Tfp pilus assembly PilM family ATPase
MANYLLGIEQSESQIKIAAFVVTGGDIKLHCLGKLPFSRNDEFVNGFVNWMSENLKEAESVDAILSISESSVYLKEFNFSNMTQEQIAESVYWEAPEIAPFSATESVVDSVTIRKGDKSSEVVGMVVKSTFIEDLVDIFEKTGVNLLTIEPGSISFSRVAKADFDKNTLLLVVEEKETDLIVLKNGVPVFSTSVSINLKPSKESRRKLEKSVITELAQNAKKSINFWEERQGEKIFQVIITGDIAYKYYGLANSINKFAKVPVVVGKRKLIKGMQTTGIPEANLNRYYVPVGAAARYLQKNYYNGVNLFPKEKKQQIEKTLKDQRRAKYLFKFSMINVYLLVLGTLFLVAVALMTNSLDKDIAQTKRFVENHPGQSLSDQINQLNSYVAGINKNNKEEVQMGAKLDRIASLTPSDVTFTNLEFAQTKGEEEWKVFGVADRDSILAFYKRLSQDLDAKEVTMPYTNISSQQENEFQIVILW